MKSTITLQNSNFELHLHMEKEKDKLGNRYTLSIQFSLIYFSYGTMTNGTKCTYQPKP